MKRITITIAAIIMMMPLFGQTWKLDKAHGKLGFTVTHLMISEVEGWFKSFDITVSSSKADFTDAVITLTADISSINTDNDYRDNSLKSDKFFDAAKFPTFTFKSTSFTRVDDKKYKLAGQLTMHGITKPVTLDVVYNGTITNPMNKQPVAGFKLTGKVKRTDFGVGESSSAIVSDDVAILANVEITRQ
jgi:polyisoprenoid-binding protein YceI